MKKIMIHVLVFMLVSTSISMSVAGNVLPEKVSHPLINGNILYVGGSGPNNYTKIQDAINDASHGDTVFVYDDSSPYYETLRIEKSIHLIGENKDTTIIRGRSLRKTVVSISSDEVTVSSFTVQNGGMGISLYNASNNTIVDNNVLSIRYYGISLKESSNNNIITGNSASKNQVGIHLWRSNDNIITANYVSNNYRYGIVLSSGCSKNNITRNHIAKNMIIGILLIVSSNNTIVTNNFLKNSIHASFQSHRYHICTNTWDQNYWGRTLTGPKLIFGRIGIQFDWHPAQEPYDIPGMT